MEHLLAICSLFFQPVFSTSVFFLCPWKCYEKHLQRLCAEVPFSFPVAKYRSCSFNRFQDQGLNAILLDFKAQSKHIVMWLHRQ